MGLWSRDLFCVLHFLSVGYRLPSASLTFPELQRVDSTNCNQGREGIQKQRRNNQLVVQPWDRVLVPTQRNTHNNGFEFFYRTGAPTQVEDGDYRLNTRFLEHSSVASLPTNQKKKKKEGHKPCSPHPKCWLLFLGTSDDHPVRSPVWPLSISSLRGANSFKLKCYYYKGECWFQSRQKIPWLRSGRERLLLC